MEKYSPSHEVQHEPFSRFGRMNERPYKASDLPQVMEVYRSSIHALAAPYYTPEQLSAWAPANPDPERWARRLESVHTLVVEHEGTIAGFASYETDGHLDLLFTHPRFARSGVASKLYRRVESALRDAGVARVFTEASLAARPFFERHGFAMNREEVVECRGVPLRRYAMHKTIPAARSTGAADSTPKSNP